MEMSDVTRAIAAATSVAASLDLPANDAIVLHNSNKLALRLTPCDVLARVAPVGQEVAQLEVELAQRLAEVGCPVGALEPRVDPLVYTRDGFAVTLWTYYEPVTPHVSPVDYAKALERLHAGMRKVDVASPRFTDRIAEAEESRCQPGSLAGARRRRPRVPQQQTRKPATGDRGPRRRGAAAPRRAASRQCAQHEERPVVHRLRDVLPWTRRVRSRPCSRGGLRALPER